MTGQVRCSDMAFYEAQYTITKSECSEYGYTCNVVAFAFVGIGCDDAKHRCKLR